MAGNFKLLTLLLCADCAIFLVLYLLLEAESGEPTDDRKCSTSLLILRVSAKEIIVQWRIICHYGELYQTRNQLYKLPKSFTA